MIISLLVTCWVLSVSRNVPQPLKSLAVGWMKSVLCLADPVALQGGHRQEAISLTRRVISNSDVFRRKKLKRWFDRSGCEKKKKKKWP